MPEWARQRAIISPDKTALIGSDETMTFAELDRRAAGIAAHLRAEGVARGDFVAVLGANSLAFACAVFGIMRAGAVLVPVNSRLTATEIGRQLHDCGARILLASGGSGLGLPLGVRTLPLSAFDARAPEIGGSPTEVDLESLHSVIYTSGTTGTPKGAMLSNGNFFWNAAGSAFNLGLREDDCWLACMPLFHVGGLSILIRGVLYGMGVEVHEGFDPERVNGALLSGRVTIVSLVATMLQRMLELHGGGYHANLRCVLLGGGPVPSALIQECLRRGIPVAPTYGLTEAASQVTTLLPSDAGRHLASAGRALLPVSIRIEREDGEECLPEEPGEIAVRGPTVTAGYLGRPDETARALRGGWLHTGDFGYVDQGGYLFVIDRRDDLIVTGGENVYPAEVESVLETHPSVKEAGVFGVADPTWGHEVRAAVALNDGYTFDEAGLIEFCRERLAGYKVPRRIEGLHELPRTASGKLLRRQLRRLAEES
jgi:O-succinylbenzoic acid--CoA ligase